MWTVFGDNGVTYDIDNVKITDTATWFSREMDIPRYELTAEIVKMTRPPKWYSAYHLNPITGNPYGIKKVIFNDPATIVLWQDGTKTVVKCQEGDNYSKEQGLALCIAKKHLGNKSNFNNEFKRWIQ